MLNGKPEVLLRLFRIAQYEFQRRDDDRYRADGTGKNNIEHKKKNSRPVYKKHIKKKKKRNWLGYNTTSHNIYEKFWLLYLLFIIFFFLSTVRWRSKIGTEHVQVDLYEIKYYDHIQSYEIQSNASICITSIRIIHKFIVEYINSLIRVNHNCSRG